MDEHNVSNGDSITYTFSPGGMEAFRDFHDDRRAAVPFDENRRGILSKAKGQLARLALVMHALEHAAATVDDDDTVTSTWSYAISRDTVEHAIHLINHFITQKFTLMPEEDTTQAPVEYSIAGVSGALTEFMYKNDMYIRKLLCCRKGCVTAAQVSQLRLMPPSRNGDSKTKYPACEAKQFLKHVSELGFGEIVVERGERMTARGVVPSGKSSVQLRKRKYEELPDASIEVLKKLKVSREEYSAVISANATPETLQEGNSLPVQPTATSASAPLSDITNIIDA